MGNKLRFANHSQNSKYMNAYSKNIFSDGSQKICLYALRDILKGEEIRFDYDGNNQMVDKFAWVNDKDEDDLKIQEREMKAANKKGKPKKTLSKKLKLDQVNSKMCRSSESNDEKNLINKKRTRNNDIESNGEINTIEETDSMHGMYEPSENFAIQDCREVGEFRAKNDLKLNDNIINLLSN